jgi:hypothetical protein
MMAVPGGCDHAPYSIASKRSAAPRCQALRLQCGFRVTRMAALSTSESLHCTAQQHTARSAPLAAHRSQRSARTAPLAGAALRSQRTMILPQRSARSAYLAAAAAPRAPHAAQRRSAQNNTRCGATRRGACSPSPHARRSLATCPPTALSDWPPARLRPGPPAR